MRDSLTGSVLRVSQNGNGGVSETGWDGGAVVIGSLAVGTADWHVGTGTLGTAGVAFTAGTPLDRKIEESILQNGNFYSLQVR